MKQKSPTSAKTIFFLIGLFSFLLNSGTIIAQQVSTYAGFGFGGMDGVLEPCAQFAGPHGIAADNSGIIYVADRFNHAIRKITPDGQVTTIAGNGTEGYADGVGSNASFSHPTAIVLDNDGNILVVDSYNNRIRKVTPSGTVTTVAGDGIQDSDDGTISTASFYHPSGITIDATGNIFVADTYNHRIRKIAVDGTVSTLAGSTVGAADGQGSSALFNQPIGITFASNGLLYVTDRQNHIIRSVTPDGTVSLVAGSYSNGSNDGIGFGASFQSPSGIIFDYNTGNLYVTDAENNRIRRVSLTGEVTTISGTVEGLNDGIASLAKYSSPIEITVDNDGNLLVSDFGTAVIRKVTFPAIVTSTIAGSGSYGFSDGIGTSASFQYPYDIELGSDGNFYIAEASRIRKISNNSTVTTIAGNGTVGNADGVGTEASFGLPMALALDTDGNIFVIDVQFHTVRKITPDGTVTTFAGNNTIGSNDGLGTNASFNYPNDLTIDSQNNLFVADYQNNKIRKITPDGNVTTFSGSGLYGNDDGPANSATFPGIISIAIDQYDILYVLDGSYAIRKILPDGSVTTIPTNYIAGEITPSSTDFQQPNRLTIDVNGIIYVTDLYKVHRILPDGRRNIIAGDEMNINNGYFFLDGIRYNASFNSAKGIICDPSGLIYLTDELNHKIRTITPCQTSDYFSVTCNSPSVAGNCDGEASTHTIGLGSVKISIDGSSFIYTGGTDTYLSDQCPGVHDLQIITECDDTIHVQYVIPLETNIIVNNTYPDSTAVDTLGVTLIDCTIDYTSIIDAYIDSSWFANDTVTVIWNIVDDNGIHSDTAIYFLDDPNGVYWLQLNLFCPNRAEGDYFSVMETIYFNGNLLNVSNIPEKLIEVSVFPNPTDNLFTIQTSSNKIIGSITDSQGKLMQTFSLTQTTTIDASEWSDGIYFLELQSEEGRAVKRLVKL